MIVIADTSALVAAHDEHESEHAACRDSVAQSDLLVVSPLVLAEFDYLIAKRFGESSAIAACDEIAYRARDSDYAIPALTPDVITEASLVRVRYRALRLGLTDAVNVVLASQFRTDAVLTLDRRHFRAVAPLQEDSPAFRLLPEDGLDRPRDQHQ